MTKDELADLVVFYAHRPDLKQATLDTFIPLAETRIGRELKSLENETDVLLQPTENLIDLPTVPEYGSIKSIEYLGARGPNTLTSLDAHSINQWAQTGGNPARYIIRSRKIEVRPFIAGDYRLYYYFKPTLPLNSSENDVLDAWPNVYLHGALVELNIYAQDQEQRDLQIDAFDFEVARINKKAEQGRGDKPAMRRA